MINQAKRFEVVDPGRKRFGKHNDEEIMQSMGCSTTGKHDKRAFKCLGPWLRLGVYAVCLAAILVTQVSEVHAGAFTIPLIGTRASTRLAFTGRPDDTSAVYHNPAGIGLLEEARLDISGTGLFVDIDYKRCTRAFDGEDNTPGCYDGYEDKVKPVPWGPFPPGFGILPFMGMSSRFGLENWNFAFAVYSPHNATGSWPDCERDDDGTPIDCSGAPQRFDMIRGTINTLYLNPAVAYQPHPAITLGAGFSAVRAEVSLKQGLWVGGEDGYGSDLFWDGEGFLELKGAKWSYAFNFGLIWNLGETFPINNPWFKNIRIGVSYASQTEFDFSGNIKITSPAISSLSRSCERDGYSINCHAAAKFRFPMVVRAGIDWEIHKHGSIGLDVFWQNYSIFDKIHVHFPEPIVVRLPHHSEDIVLEERIMRKDSFDAVGVGAGGQWNVVRVPGLEFRAGFLWDQSPYPDSTYSIINPDADKWGFSVGASYRFNLARIGQMMTQLEISAGYGAMVYKKRRIRDSILVPSICPPDHAECHEDFPEADFSVNGDINHSVHLFVLQVSGILTRIEE